MKSSSSGFDNSAASCMILLTAVERKLTFDLLVDIIDPGFDGRESMKRERCEGQTCCFVLMPRQGRA